MRRKQIYTDDQREDILICLWDNFDDIPLTSHQTGVPQRTLREWRAAYLAANPDFQPPGAPTFADPPKNISAAAAANAAEVADQFILLREKLMQQIFTLVSEVSDKAGDASFRAIAIARLLDRVHKLDTLIPALRPPPHEENVYRVEYLYPDGSVHDNPPWYQPGPDDPPIWSPVRLDP
ncbi:MAG: hypothetical protein H7X77_01570 [Anaerolineae bacterium]|nr:hypothetical protein [Anaerolineae bacterium]